MPENANNTALTSLGQAIESLVSEAVQKAVGTNQSVQGTEQIQQQKSANTDMGVTVTDPTPGSADITSVSQANQQNVTNMKTGEYVSPYQQEQQQLLGQLQQQELPEISDTAKKYRDNIFAQQMEKLNYNPEEDPLVKKAREQLQQSIMDMASKRGFAYGSYLDDAVKSQIDKMAPQFENIAYNRNSDYLNRQIALGNVMIKWETMQFDRKKNAIELLRTKLDFINKLDQREFSIFKMMMDQRNIQRSLHFQELRMDYKRQNQEMTNALNRIELVGYVDNKSSIILGMPVGTKAKWAQQAALDHQNRLEKLAKENEYAIQKQNLDAQMDKELFALQSRLDEASKMKYQALEYQYKQELSAMEFEFEKQKSSIVAAKAAASRSYGGGGGGSSGGGSGSGYTNSQLDSKYTSEAKAFIKKFGNKSSYGQDAALYLDSLARSGVPQEVLMRMKDEFGIPTYKAATQSANLVEFNWGTGELKVSGKKVTTSSKKKKK